MDCGPAWVALRAGRRVLALGRESGSNSPLAGPAPRDILAWGRSTLGCGPHMLHIPFHVRTFIITHNMQVCAMKVCVGAGAVCLGLRNCHILHSSTQHQLKLMLILFAMLAPFPWILAISHILPKLEQKQRTPRNKTFFEHLTLVQLLNQKRVVSRMITFTIWPGWAALAGTRPCWCCCWPSTCNPSHEVS